MNAPENSPRKVLVCEDDPVQLRIFSALFEQAGYRSLPARNSAEAVAMARRFGADAVFTDVMLESGSGFDLLGDLRQIGLDAPVIMTSAYATEGMKARALEAGVKDFLEKPVNLAQIRRRVDGVFRRSPAPRPTVLIVESQDGPRTALVHAAAEAGFRPLWAEDGRTALEMLRKAKTPPGVMIMDLHARAPSGVSLIRDALRLRADLHIVMMSGEAGREMIRAGYAAGAAAMVRKPLSAEEIARMLKQAQAAAQAKRRRAQERRERRERHSRQPWTQRVARRVRRFCHGTATWVAVASLVMGVTLAWGLGLAFEAFDRSEKMAEAALPLAVRSDGSGPAVRAFARWQALGQLQMSRQANDVSHRSLAAQIQEMMFPRTPLADSSRPAVNPDHSVGNAASLAR